MGPGFPIQTILDTNPSLYDFILEMECGRSPDGTFPYTVPSYRPRKRLPPTAVWFIDSHGNPTLHKRLAEHYDHVFFAVHDKRNLFANHPSAHWCPNATDVEFFGPQHIFGVEPEFNFGFIGSKGGLHRANDMKEICDAHGWTYDIRQVSKAYRHKWPHTAEAMANCRFLFNHGQKHDGPNLRVVESMLLGRPLLNDLDPNSGLELLFEEGKHFLGYTNTTDLEAQMINCMSDELVGTTLAEDASNLVRDKHLIIHRAEQILEVVNG